MKTFILDLVNPFNTPLKPQGWPLWWGNQQIAKIETVHVSDKNQVEFLIDAGNINDDAYVTVCRNGNFHLVAPNVELKPKEQYESKVVMLGHPGRFY